MPGASAIFLSKDIVIILSKDQTFYYIRRITPKRVTSLWCPYPRRSIQRVEAVANRLQRRVRFGRRGSYK